MREPMRPRNKPRRMRLTVFGHDDPADRRISDTAAVAACLDQVTEVQQQRPGRDSVYVRVLGRLAGCRTVEIATFLDSADAGRLDELLAPLRALIRTADGA